MTGLQDKIILITGAAGAIGGAVAAAVQTQGGIAIASDLKDLAEFPTPEDAPEFYVDYGETGPFVAAVGDSECAV